LVGAIVAYVGDDYAQRRDVTFDMLSALIEGSFDPEKMDPETQAGEYYFDSLAVMPSCRGKGVARLLMQSRIDYAKSLGRPVILACSPDNLGAKRLYEALGFRDTHIYSLFGHPYWRMVNE
ncbi:MAG: GNAT family N-acetyltransferase, partial [Sodaliphilus sp.]|nr:GNAT family N-acetyltransferase [Sodaliphilus sp.]